MFNYRPNHYDLYYKTWLSSFIDIEGIIRSLLINVIVEEQKDAIAFETIEGIIVERDSCKCKRNCDCPAFSLEIAGHSAFGYKGNDQKRAERMRDYFVDLAINKLYHKSFIYPNMRDYLLYQVHYYAMDVKKKDFV